MNILDSIEWIFIWMNIPDFVLNWIIFRPDSMKKLTFKTDRPGLGWQQAGTTCGASSQQIRPRIISSYRVCWLFCDIRDKSAVFIILRQNMTNFDVGRNKERMRKCRVWISLHFLILPPFPHSLSISSPFPLHFLIFSSFPRSPAARLQRFVQPWVTGLMGFIKAVSAFITHFWVCSLWVGLWWEHYCYAHD